MRLRHRIRIQSNTPSQDAAGQPVESWSTYHTCWADVKDVNGAEIQGDPIEGIAYAHATIRYPHKGRIPQPTDRWLHGEGDVLRTFNVERVQRMDGHRRMLLLEGAEVQS